MNLGRSDRGRLRTVVAVLTIAIAVGFLVLAVLLLVLTALCGMTGAEAQVADCRRAMVWQAVRAAALAIPFGLIGALSLGIGRD